MSDSKELEEVGGRFKVEVVMEMKLRAATFRAPSLAVQSLVFPRAATISVLGEVQGPRKGEGAGVSLPLVAPIGQKRVRASAVADWPAGTLDVLRPGSF